MIDSSYREPTPPRTAEEATAHLQWRLPLWEKDLDQYVTGVSRIGSEGMAEMMQLRSQIQAEAQLFTRTQLDDPTWAAYGALLGKAWQQAEAWANSRSLDVSRLASGTCCDVVRAIIAMKLPPVTAPAPASSQPKPAAVAV